MEALKNKILGLCECGCGELVPIAKRTDSIKGWEKGQPIRFIKGHQNRGRIHSKEARKRISASLKGNKNRSGQKKRNENRNGQKKRHGCSVETRKKMSEAAKGHHRNLGRKHSVETRKKMSKNHARISGKNHTRYNPNLTDEERNDKRDYPDYYEWRVAVYKRDKYTCQHCRDKSNGSLNAHHIESYKDNPKLRIVITNGITFCKKCHVNFHHQYGREHNTKEQFESYIKRGIHSNG